VGTAAALCVEHGLTPRQLYRQKTLLSHLQHSLLRDDQTIYGMKNADPKDLARFAKVSASGQMDDAPAANLTNGWARNIPGKQIHYWASRMDGDGAWIELSWDSPRRIREVQITFDTGFQRELTLSAQDSVNEGMIRAAQPETVRDYEVQVRKRGESRWTSVAAITGNHQRLRRHRFEPAEAEAVRLRITATNGIQFARVFELRCYA